MFGLLQNRAPLQALSAAFLLTLSVAAQPDGGGLEAHRARRWNRDRQLQPEPVQESVQAPAVIAQPKPQSFPPVFPGQNYPPYWLLNWGGTIVGGGQPGSYNITSTGQVPAGSVVLIGHGNQVIAQAKVASSQGSDAQIQLLAGASPSPGDWVQLQTVPCPPPSSDLPKFNSANSTMNDPVYQYWLKTGRSIPVRSPSFPRV